MNTPIVAIFRSTELSRLGQPEKVGVEVYVRYMLLGHIPLSTPSIHRAWTLFEVYGRCPLTL